MEVTADKTYNLIFIGAGLSCSYSLIHFIKLAGKTGSKKHYRILVIDKSNEFWTGIPYGARSGYESLIITSLKEFLPLSERELFIAWLTQNIEKLMSDALKCEGRRFPSWMVRNKEAIAANQWEYIYIPRYLFGIYLNERMKALLNAAAHKGMLEYELVTAEITNVTKLDDGYVITANGNEGILSFITRKVVLSIGSPPKKYLTQFSSPYAPLFVEDLYEPNLPHNIERIKECLKVDFGKKKNILVLGSNASALEIIFNLHSFINLTLVDQFYIISSDGIFPHRIKESNDFKDYQPSSLTRLQNQGFYTSAQILEAVEMDTEAAKKVNLSASDIYHKISSIVIELMNKLSYEEQKKFVDHDGVQIGKFQRRAGGEYLDAVEDIMRQSKMTFIRGRFLRLVGGKEDPFRVEYYDYKDKQIKVFAVCPDIIINCIGFQELDNCSSVLIRNLIHQNICVVNGSGRGFAVNENFESCKDFFVIGPLLAGNLNSKIKVWHAESCPRIFLLSQQLAEVLVQTSM